MLKKWNLYLVKRCEIKSKYPLLELKYRTIVCSERNIIILELKFQYKICKNSMIILFAVTVLSQFDILVNENIVGFH